MKFLAVFVTLAAAAYGFPATTTWTLNELSNALQSPGLDPVLAPYLEAALNQMMTALHQGHAMDTITIAMPIVADYTLNELSSALQNPSTNPAHIPYLENALNQLMDALFAGQDKPSITVVIPADLPVPEVPAGEPGFIDVWPVQVPEQEPGFIDVWPVQVPEQEPGFIDVWPVQIPEEAPVSPVVPAPVAPSAPSSPLVQIIVNVQKQQESDVAPAVIERPSPVQVDDLPGWGNFIGDH